MEAETGADVRWALEHYGLHHDFCFRFPLTTKRYSAVRCIGSVDRLFYFKLLIRGYIPER